ncbi:hypothetical protein GCM10022244_29330 [Streptomyces gulbargensis]|uniref:Uncharacterized protein n=1 Tax=Streptomyces gulbargensis TaxID=364901 RepID=A0ABP7MA05_9ACTN
MSEQAAPDVVPVPATVVLPDGQEPQGGTTSGPLGGSLFRPQTNPGSPPDPKPPGTFTDGFIILGPRLARFREAPQSSRTPNPLAGGMELPEGTLLSVRFPIFTGSALRP